MDGSKGLERRIGQEGNRTERQKEKNAMAKVGWMDEWRVDWPMHGTRNIFKIAVIQSMMHRRIHGILCIADGRSVCVRDLRFIAISDCRSCFFVRVQNGLMMGRELNHHMGDRQ